MKRIILAAVMTVAVMAAKAQTPTNKVYMRKGVAYRIYACPNRDHHLYYEWWTTYRGKPALMRHNLTWVTWIGDRKKIKTIK